MADCQTLDRAYSSAQRAPPMSVASYSPVAALLLLDPAVPFVPHQAEVK